MEMGAELVSMEWFNVLLRLAALVLFGLGVASAYLLTNFTKINMRKLALWVDAVALALASMLPLEPALVGIYPIFFASAFQWGVYSGADMKQNRIGSEKSPDQGYIPMKDRI